MQFGANNPIKNKLVALLAILVLILGACYLGLRYSFLQEYENTTWDWRMSLVADPKQADKKIKIIAIDQISIDYWSEEELIYWPWPRTLYIPIVEYLKAAGAKGLAFDLLFTENQFQSLEDDREFARSSLSFPFVTAVTLTPTEYPSIPEKEQSFLARQQGLQRTNKNQSKLSLLPEFQSATLPYQELLDESATFGNVWQIPDSDGVFRHYIPAGYYKGTIVHGLPFALYQLASKNPYVLSSTKDLLDQHGRLSVRFHGPSETYDIYNFNEIFFSYLAIQAGQTPQVALEEFKDAWVFVGPWAAGLFDNRRSPMGQEFKGVEFNAAVLDNLLHQNFFTKISFGGAFALSSLCLAFLTMGVFYLQRPRWQFAWVFLILAGFTWAQYSLLLSGVWAPLYLPLVLFIFSCLIVLAYQYYFEGKQKRFVKTAFSHYLSPRVIDRIMEDPDLLTLGGERKELSILFSDIYGFTSISENMSPQKLSSFLNIYLNAVSETILERDGTLDKFEGDAVIAFWNAPLEVNQHALQAVVATIEARDKLLDLQKVFESDFGINVRTRFGLHTGDVSVGNYGSDQRFDYTIIGDAANLASRLEGANKVFGTSVLVSEATKIACGNAVVFRTVGQIKVVGRKQAITVYEPLRINNSNFVSDLYIRFNKAYELYEAGKLEEALGLFVELRGDSVAEAYVHRISKELEYGVGDQWSPIWLLDSK